MTEERGTGSVLARVCSVVTHTLGEIQLLLHLDSSSERNTEQLLLVSTEY